MNTPLSERAIATIADSWPLLQRHRRDIGAAMRRYLAQNCDVHGDTDDIAFAILEMLFDHARELAGRTRLQRIEETVRRHRLLGIRAGDYSCFGDGFGAVLKDLLGAQATASLLSAWGDAYWTIVRCVSRRQLPLAA